MTIHVDADAAHAADALTVIDHELAVACSRLGDVTARALGIARQTDWWTDAARTFHARADEWCRRVALLGDEVDGARGELATVRHGLQLQAWGWGL